MTLALRPPEQVMSVERAAAVVPNALSFSRAAMRRLVRGRWQIRKVRFELDAEGRGEVLYRLHGAGWTFHFFLVSTKLDEAQKTDRNFAQSWDAMGVLCQGQWTAEREACLRREVPKQRAGYADYDTLIYARGNRSARLFEHVVDCLASGKQPDAGLLAPVGYVLRTTAFIGNGQLGTRPLSGFEADHPLRLPYHAQFCSAFMLREFVFDLVDHIARARSPNAARLAPPFRRYLGLGNSAATGLVAFVANHPHFMQQWTSTYERALAEALRRPMEDAAAERFERLLAKAMRHFSEGAREPDGIFTAPQHLSDELAQLQAAFACMRRDAGAERSWLAVRDWCNERLGREATELFQALLLELYPDIVDAGDETLLADEHFDLQPEVTVDALRRCLDTTYAWALPAASAHRSRYFWYRSSAAPRDVRRGVHGRAPSLEAETCMDTVRQVRALHARLVDMEGAAPIGEVAARHPDLRHVIARVQSLAALPYAELREDWLAADFSPFAPIRFALSFFGLEKFEAAPPKSVRGTFLQGAPIAEDVAAGHDGDWPFPLRPTTASPTRAPRLDALPRSRPSPRRVEAPPSHPSDPLRIAPGELLRMVQTALQGHGVALGVAEEVARHLLWAIATEQASVANVLAGLTRKAGAVVASMRGWPPPGDAMATLDGELEQPWSLLPSMLDVACARGTALPGRVGAALLTNAAGSPAPETLAIRCAERGQIALVLWHDPTRVATSGWALAGPGSDGPWYAVAGLPGAPAGLAAAAHSSSEKGKNEAMCPLNLSTDLPDVKRLATAISEAIRPASATAALEQAHLLICVRADATLSGDALVDELRDQWPALRIAKPQEMRRRWDMRGIALSRAEFAALSDAGASLLVPKEDEARILDVGVDPLKVF